MSVYTTDLEYVQRAEAAAQAAEASEANVSADKTAVSNMLSSMQAIVNNSATLPNPTITVNKANGLITASYTPTTGNILSASQKSDTLSITSISGTNLTAENIKNGITIFGVTGSYSGSSFNFSGADVTVNDMLASVKAYDANGDLITGNIQTVTATLSGNVVTVPVGYIAVAQEITVSDANLTAENIKSGVTILGVTGTYVAAAASGIEFFKCSAVQAGSSEPDTFTISGYVYDLGEASFNGTYTKWSASDTANFNTNMATSWVAIYSFTDEYGNDSYIVKTSDGDYKLVGINPSYAGDDVVMLSSSDGITWTDINGSFSSTGTVTNSGFGSGTWSGYKIVVNNNTVELAQEATSNLNPGSTTPVVGTIYAYYNDAIIGVVPNLEAANIKSGITIFGVTGSYASESSVDITLGVIDSNNKFQALSFDGTTASNSGTPETVEYYKTWDTTITPQSGSGNTGSIDFYKCSSVSSETWSGYRAIVNNGVYEDYETSVTSGLTYGSAFTPEVGKVYNNGATILATLNNTLMYATLNQSLDINGGGSLTSVGTITYSLGRSTEYAASVSPSNYIRTGITTADIQGDFTIDFWVKLPDTSDRYAIIAAGSDGRIGIDTYYGTWNMWASTDGNWDILQSDYPDEYNSGNGSIQCTTDWTHIAFVRKDDDWYLFVNGQLSVHKERSGLLNTANSSEICLGRWGDANFTHGAFLIEKVRISNKALWTNTFTPPA